MLLFGVKPNMKNSSALLTSIIMASAAVMGACSSDGSGSDERMPLSTLDVGAGWTIAVPAEWTVAGVFGEPVVNANGCVVDQIVVIHGDIRTEVARLGHDCSADATGRGNGTPADFGSADQIYTGFDFETSRVPSGILTMATVQYYECANECDFSEPDVGVITLDEIDDSSFPTIVIRDDNADTTRDDIEFIAQHLTHS